MNVNKLKKADLVSVIEWAQSDIKVLLARISELENNEEKQPEGDIDLPEFFNVFLPGRLVSEQTADHISLEGDLENFSFIIEKEYYKKNEASLKKMIAIVIKTAKTLGYRCQWSQGRWNLSK